MLKVQHPRMANVFYQRNTKQSQEQKKLRSKDLEIDSSWYECRYYVDLYRHLCKGTILWLKTWMASLMMLNLVNDKTQSQPSQSVTE